MTTLGTGLRDGVWTVDAGATIASFSLREFGLLPVRGRLTVTDGSVTVADGRPVAATATLDAGSIATGIRRRDRDLAGPHFLAAADCPLVEVGAREIVPDGDGWVAAAVLTVAGAEAPVTLRATAHEGAAGRLAVSITGALHRAAVPIRAVRFLMGRRIALDVRAALRPPD